MNMFEGFGFGETMQAQAAAYVCWACGLCAPPTWETELPEYEPIRQQPTEMTMQASQF